jgi:WD40 repeat protein
VENSTERDEKISQKNVSRRAILFGLGSLGLAVASYRSMPSAQAQAAGLFKSAPHARTKFAPGQTIVTYQDHFIGGVTDGIWSPDSAGIAVCGQNHSIDLFHARNGQTTKRLSGPGSNGTILSWAANGRYLASAGPNYSNDTTVKIWDTHTGRFVHTYGGHTAPVSFVAFSPDGTRVASVAFDHTVQVWNPTTFKPLYVYHVPDLNPATRLAWSPDGKYMVSGVDGLASGYVNPTVRVWNSRNGKQLTSWSGNVNCLAWSPDGQSIASTEGRSLVLRHARTGKAYRTYTYATQVLGVDWSRDGKRVVVSGGSTQAGNNDGFAQVITLSTNTQLTYTGHKLTVLTVAFSPDNTRVVSASLDNTAQVWQI